MNIKNNLEVINFLKSTSKVYQENGNEIVIHCPYCDDALRANARSHGHLYISVSAPVFHCFRCETSGFLGTLLRDLGFTNLEVLSELGSLKFLQSSERSLIKKKTEKSIYETIRSKNFNFRLGETNNYYQFEKYVFSRIGSFCDIDRYLITPEVIDKKLCASFYNADGNYVTSRILNPMNNYRYVRSKGVSELYYFQELDFDTYEEIVLGEGVFDVLKLYRFSDLFPKNKTFYMAILGKNYGRVVNWLLESQIPIGSYRINLVFDNDNKFQKKSIHFCRKIANRINPNVEVNGFRPVLLNDAAEFPFLEKIN